MPSRPISANENPISSTPFLQTKAFFLIITISSSVLIFFIICYFTFYLYPSILHRSRTTPLDSNPPSKLKRFTYRELKKATNSFNVANMLGRGGSGTVYRGVLRDGKSIAVKKLDPFSLQAEREFQNELQILGGLKSPYIVTLLGFCVDNNNRALVYDYMPNRSLQESLFGDEKDFLNWVRRFKIIVEIAKALSFLHHDCDPPVIHGDVKPSNVLLDSSHVAKLSDFGLSRIKEVDGEFAVAMFSQELSGDLQGHSNNEVDFALALQSSNFNTTSNRCYNNNHLNVVNEFDLNKSKGKVASNSADTGVEEMNNFDHYDDELCSSIEHSKELNISTNSAQWGKDWWWKQDANCELSSKDYVSEWIGNQITPSQDLDWEKMKKNCPENSLSLGNSTGLDKMEDENKKHMNMQEWWTEEHLNEISKKKGTNKKGFKIPHFDLGRKNHFKKRRKIEENTENNNDVNKEFSFRRSGKRRNRTHSGGSDQMYSGDLFSRELSSNTSMRGTLCYIAPEYGSCSHLIEKTDIYSLGVLILVIVSGRRPLHVLASPMKLEKANLVSWCRNLALGGNILDLVDEKLVKDGFNKDEASLCINLALICLQKMPELRPDVGEIVRILEGEMELPPLPFEFSPSPPSKLFGKSRRKQKSNAE